MHISNGKMVTGERKKSNKISKILIAGIIICTVMIIGIVALMLYMQTSILKVYVDGQPKTVSKEVITVDKETGKMSIALQDFAKLLGYQYNNGEYNDLSEDTDKCYIQTSNEAASFFANSNIIYKSPITKDRSTYEYYDLGDIVKQDQATGKLYTNEKGAELGCNINIEYSAKTNTLSIFTLPYLVEHYKAEATKWGYLYEGDKNDYENQKALLYGFVIVKKDKSSNKVGVVNTKKQELLGIKYDKLKFNENTNEFFAYDDNKVGLVSVKGEVLIPIKYEDIQVLDKDLELYVVTNNKKKGVANKQGEYVIYTEYDEIGIKSSEFKNDRIVNPYLLMGEVIPVQKNQKWGLFDKKGNQILPLEYDKIGCNGTNGNKANSETTNSLAIIPNYKAIILKKNDKYGIYNTKGVELVQCALDSAYSTSKSGVNTYYMVYNGQVMNIAEYLNKFMPESTKQQTDEQQGEEEQTSEQQYGNEQNNEQQGGEQQNSEGQTEEQQDEEQQNSEQQTDEQQGEEEQNDEQYDEQQYDEEY